MTAFAPPLAIPSYVGFGRKIIAFGTDRSPGSVSSERCGMSFSDAIDAERRIRATELALLPADFDEMISRAAIERLIGRDL